MTGEPGAPAFVDTNIWLYAFLESDDASKASIARELLQTCQPVVSVQIVNEVCVNLIKKAGFQEDQIRRLIDAFYVNYPISELNQTILTSASQLRQRYALSFWDSLVIACALDAQVGVLYTEDIQHGLVINNSLRIVNPFAT